MYSQKKEKRLAKDLARSKALILLMVVTFCSVCYVFVFNRDSQDTLGNESINTIENIENQNDDNQMIDNNSDEKTADEDHHNGLDTSSIKSEGLDLLTLINKRNSISPIDYSPPQLVSPDVEKRSGTVLDARAAEGVEKLFAAAKEAGYTFMLSNGFRSFSTQSSLYNGYVSRDGVAVADTYSARPGYSEHQSGLAADVILPSGQCSLEQCFGDLPEGQWLEENVTNYGFIIRYTRINESETGYSYEPWHIRFIGGINAREYKERGSSSLESFLSRPPATDYL